MIFSLEGRFLGQLDSSSVLLEWIRWERLNSSLRLAKGKSVSSILVCSFSRNNCSLKVSHDLRSCLQAEGGSGWRKGGGVLRLVALLFGRVVGLLRDQVVDTFVVHHLVV